MDAAARRVHEVVDAPSAPAPAVEQLDLQEPKKPSQTLLSEEQPFFDIDLVMPHFSHFPIQPSQRQ